MTDYTDYLNTHVLQENKPVTYKSLARSLGIHVNTAKQALYEFSKDQKNVYATYCISGTALQNDQFNIQLTKESDLEETKKKFKQISGIHVYSVTSFDPNDFSILYAACKDIPKLSLEDRVKCGILKNKKVAIREVTSARLMDNKSAPAANKKSAPTTSLETKSSTTTSSKAASAPKATKRKGTLSFGPATAKKQAVTTPTKNEPKPKPVHTKPSATTKAQNKNTKADHDEIEKRMAKATIKASDIFSDDEDDNEVEEQPPQETEDLDIEEDVDMQDLQEAEPSAQNEKQKDKLSPSESTTSAPVGKARRKVLKKKTTKNARGFLVTEEVWEFESADEEEVESKSTTTHPKPAASVKNSSSAKNGAAAKKPSAQSSLFNFFKKT